MEIIFILILILFEVCSGIFSSGADSIPKGYRNIFIKNICPWGIKHKRGAEYLILWLKRD